MTKYDYVIVMTDVKIAELKAHLSEHLRNVRRGDVLTVLDRSTPIAQVIRYAGSPDALRVREPLRRVRTLRDVPLPRPLELDADIAELLMEERQGER